MFSNTWFKEKTIIKYFIIISFLFIFCTSTSLAIDTSIAEKHRSININMPSGLVDTNKIKDEINTALQKRFPDAKILSFKQIPKNSTVIYDCDVLYQGSTLKLYINPQNGVISGKIDERELFEEKITRSGISRGTKEVNNVLKQIKLDASFSDVKYNKKDKTLEGSILYTGLKYYFKLNTATGEIIEMIPLE